MKDQRLKPGRFGVNKPFLWGLVAFGALFVAVGLVVALEVGFRGLTLGLLAIGAAIAGLPWALIRRDAAIEVDAQAGRLTFLPGGETTEMAQVTKINFNKISRGLALSVADPEWRLRMRLTFRYPMLAHLSLAGYRINTRMLADGRGFAAAVEAMGRRQQSID